MVSQRPWIRGLIDGLNASNLVRVSSIPHRNRIALIILDSTLEIAFKNFLVNVKKITLPQEKWKFRDPVIKAVKNNFKFDDSVWQDVNYFYDLRLGLYHEDSEKTVIDETIGNFQELVEFMIDNLFNIKCSDLIAIPQSLIPSQTIPATQEESITDDVQQKIPINNIPEKINVVLVAVKESQSKNPQDIIEVLRKKGLKANISKNTISVYLNHQSFSYLFHKEDGIWKLSETGEERYEDLRKSYLPDYKKEGSTIK